jgi:hypothetical protein
VQVGVVDRHGALLRMHVAVPRSALDRVRRAGDRHGSRVPTAVGGSRMVLGHGCCCCCCCGRSGSRCQAQYVLLVPALDAVAVVVGIRLVAPHVVQIGHFCDDGVVRLGSEHLGSDLVQEALLHLPVLVERRLQVPPPSLDRPQQPLEPAHGLDRAAH